MIQSILIKLAIYSFMIDLPSWIDFSMLPTAKEEEKKVRNTIRVTLLLEDVCVVVADDNFPYVLY